MSGFIIRDADSAPAVYFAPGAPGSPVPAATRWSDDPAHALSFAREEDARTFIDVFLPRVSTFATIVPHPERA